MTGLSLCASAAVAQAEGVGAPACRCTRSRKSFSGVCMVPGVWGAACTRLPACSFCRMLACRRLQTACYPPARWTSSAPAASPRSYASSWLQLRGQAFSTMLRASQVWLLHARINLVLTVHHLSVRQTCGSITCGLNVCMHSCTIAVGRLAGANARCLCINYLLPRCVMCVDSRLEGSSR